MTVDIAELLVGMYLSFGIGVYVTACIMQFGRFDNVTWKEWYKVARGILFGVFLSPIALFTLWENRDD